MADPQLDTDAVGDEAAALDLAADCAFAAQPALGDLGDRVESLPPVWPS